MVAGTITGIFDHATLHECLRMLMRMSSLPQWPLTLDEFLPRDLLISVSFGPKLARTPFCRTIGAKLPG